jgi:site-specific recombinase
MNIKKFHLIDKWRKSSQDRIGLDVLLGQAPAPATPLRERLKWLSQLLNWARTDGLKSADLNVAKSKLPAARLKYILQILERNAEMKNKVAETLRSIIHETSALELFMNIGIPNQESFLGEFVERLQLLLLPQPPHDNDIIFVFSETFKYFEDVQWIQEMDPALFQDWINLFRFSKGTVDPGWNTLISDARDALYLLSHQVRTIGLSRLIRQRVSIKHFQELPFYTLTEKVDKLLSAPGEAELNEAYNELKLNISECFKIINRVHKYFSERGANLSLVYQLMRLDILLSRVQTLARLLADYKNNPAIIQQFMSSLIYENTRARGFSSLLEDNMVLISQKIIETNAETGEHYISRGREEYFSTIKRALGGGLITAFTIIFKFRIVETKLVPFVSGFLQSLDYALSFLLLQATGFILATKQPAMTATVIAQKIPEANESLIPLIDEITLLIRSQLATVAGNLWGVIPSIVIIEVILSSFGNHVTSVAHAEHTIDSFSILGMTPFYAALTGVLLWLSSVFAGWFYNWFCYRGLPEAIEHQRRLVYVFGAHGAKKIADFLKRNMAGFASNISLGFLLGMTPEIGGFFGPPLEVRHVTLSTGSMAASAWILGPDVLNHWPFWLGILGLASMAILNLAVSFGLALIVAIWAKRAPAPKRHVIYAALLKRFFTHPGTFFFPEKS